ncbi:MAG: hypothetical protein KAI47_07130 [Deltaproteobacteria bacterium]|nr:hypothetical protein [Deltaproteobacteria bacterium]
MHKHVRRVTWCVPLALALLVSCKESGEGGFKGNPRQDSAPVPFLSISLSSPTYGETSVGKDRTIGFGDVEGRCGPIGHYGSREACVKAAQEGLVIETYPGGKAVQGSWGQGVYDRDVFTPAAPLAEGDYVIRVPNPEIVVRPRPYNVFRVGSALRPTWVEIHAKKSDKARRLVDVKVRFSEFRETFAGVKVTVEAKNAKGAWEPLASAKGDGARTNVLSMASSRVIDPHELLRVSISGSALDGAWTGGGGSGPVVVEFVPAEYSSEPGQIEYPIPPKLSISLPSGKPKAK